MHRSPVLYIRLEDSCFNNLLGYSPLPFSPREHVIELWDCASETRKREWKMEDISMDLSHSFIMILFVNQLLLLCLNLYKLNIQRKCASLSPSCSLLAFFCSFISLVLSGVAPKGDLQLHGELDGRSWCASSPTGTHKRKEWCVLFILLWTVAYLHLPRRSLSKMKSRDYIDAVHCLRKKPSLYNEITGCKSHYDDFQVLHIKQTFIVHTNVRNRYPSIPFIHSAIRLDIVFSHSLKDRQDRPLQACQPDWLGN